MNAAELIEAFPKLIEELCKNPAAARALQDNLAVMELVAKHQGAFQALVNDKAAVMPIVDDIILYSSLFVVEKVRPVRKTATRSLNCRLDPRS